MSLFDIVKEKAAELFSGASEKVNDLTGVELPGAEAAENATRPAEELADSAQGLGDTATDAARDATGTATEAADAAIPDVTDPRG